MVCDIAFLTDGFDFRLGRQYSSPSWKKARQRRDVENAKRGTNIVLQRIRVEKKPAVERSNGDFATVITEVHRCDQIGVRSSDLR